MQSAAVALVMVDGSAVAAWCMANDFIWYLTVVVGDAYQSSVSTTASIISVNPTMDLCINTEVHDPTQTPTCHVDRLFLS